MKYLDEVFKDVFFLQNFGNILVELFHKFTMKFYFFYPYKCDRLYLANFIYTLKENLTMRLIYGHTFWCQRKNILDSECRLCCQVFKWDSDSNYQFLFSSNCMNFWDTHVGNYFLPVLTVKKIVKKI